MGDKVCVCGFAHSQQQAEAWGREGARAVGGVDDGEAASGPRARSQNQPRRESGRWMWGCLPSGRQPGPVSWEAWLWMRLHFPPPPSKALLLITDYDCVLPRGKA